MKNSSYTFEIWQVWNSLQKSALLMYNIIRGYLVYMIWVKVYWPYWARLKKKTFFLLTLNIMVFQSIWSKALNFFLHIPMVVYCIFVCLNFGKKTLFFQLFLSALKNGNFSQFLLQMCLSPLGVSMTSRTRSWNILHTCLLFLSLTITHQSLIQSMPFGTPSSCQDVPPRSRVPTVHTHPSGESK